MARLAPFLFVLLWSTGFIGAKLGLPHAAPLSFLLVRYLLVISLMISLALLWRAPWPRDGRIWLHIGISGLLVHGLYLGGVFVAIGKGLPAGVTSLVVGLQPLLTATVAGWLLGEAIRLRQWVGLSLGFVGVALVVSGKLGSGFALDALWPAFAALLGITAGTLYQKRFCPNFDWRSGAVLQFIPTAVVTGAIVWAQDDYRIDWTGEFVFALGWLVLVLSVGAISMLNWLIRHGNAVNVASLFYLTPPTTALLAWLIFGETLSGVALFGMALAVWGVYLARR
ncbi:MAG: DMT family transporter [Rhodocyclaceae bacterium]|nr:DMT family transporter [Rhodocyclaceae bacterium]